MATQSIGHARETGGWFVVQHVPYEGPGLIARVAHARDLRLHVVRRDRGDALPDPETVAGLIVMGGPMSVYDHTSFPGVDAERRLVERVVARGAPVLGVCLGAQILAAALGSKVYAGGRPEIGFGSVRLTDAAREDRLFAGLGDEIPVFHWHGDTFDRPAGTAHLAASAVYPNQAFRAGSHAYAVQFHLELDRALADRWRPHLPAGIDIDERQRAAVERVGRVVLERFFDSAA